jgi:hypothetical protein
MWKFGLLLAAFAVPGVLRAYEALVWHFPVNHQEALGSSMRNPVFEAADSDLTIYHAFFKNNGVGGNQTGGRLFWRSTPRGGTPGAWSDVPLEFHLNHPSDFDVVTQYWKATLPSTSIPVTDVIEYYIETTFAPGGPETTYIHGADSNSIRTTVEEDAQAAPCSIRNRPGWIYHANNRTIAGDDIQLRVKTGYIGPDNDPATLWANLGAVYYTTDGTTPNGVRGNPVPQGTSSSVLLELDGIEGDDSGNGNAVWWRATLPGVLDGLPIGGEVKYMIGFWNPVTNEEQFADYIAGADNTVFVYQNGNIGDPLLTINGLNANYTTTKLFVDEIAGDTLPLNIVFEPGEPDIVAAEVYTNLNRRDRADDDANGDGYDDGISGLDGNSLVAGDDAHYFKAYEMTDVGAGSYSLTLNADKTGAYRLTARWKVAGDPNWRWYSNQAANRRDHAITVSPKNARDIVLYEINVLNIEATDDTFQNRSTIEDMHNAAGAWHNGNNRWDLDYLTSLGANWLWFQPIHPPARDGREPFGGWGSGNPPYEPGSPYAVKNFFEVSPIMSRSFSGDPFNDGDLLNQANRDAAMTAWQNFVAAADTREVGIMLDAPFNHTAFDVELAQAGVDLLQPDGQTWSRTDEIRNREARFFSNSANYGNRAFDAGSIAAGPDRYDFGKWNDVKDVFFGRYDALVEFDAEPERSSYTSEGDWFDATDSDWTSNDFVRGGQNRNVTRQVWKYFATYATHWLEKTRPAGENRNSSTEAGLSTAQRYAWDAAGIDGLRCDFGQGLPPRAWEYIINVARERKWNFVMMSESLDGGAVTYRSNRHFDILNENIVFPLRSATDKWAYRGIFEDRRNAYGAGLVLINNVSHDEENYLDPWQALIRYSVAATLDGVPMIFPGQELGISRTYGYDHYELNFGKQIPHFKRFNSMQPAWTDTNYGNDQLFPVYAGMGAARNFSPALRSSNRWFLDGDGDNPNIHAVAKYQSPGAGPAVQDVVLAFANLDRDNDQSDNFKIPAALAGQIGLQDGRTYNVKNIAAYENDSIGMGDRRDAWLWGGGYTGDQLKNGGFLVNLRDVPVLNSDWAGEPFEAQYLKLYDVTAPTNTPAKPAMPNAYPYAIGDSVVFDWFDVGPDFGGVFPVYEVSVTVNGGDAETFITSASEFTVNAAEGDTVSISVRAVNPEDNGNAGPASESSETVVLLPAGGDEDNDGRSNGDEDAAGTDPQDGSSFFRAVEVRAAGADNEVVVESVMGRLYQLEWSADLGPGSWTAVGPEVTAGETPTTLTDPGGAAAGARFYRVKVRRP